MAIDVNAWTSALYAELSGRGMSGDSLMDLCQAVAACGNVIKGSQFTTTDTGLVAGTGVGTGVGVSISGTSVSSQIQGLGWGGDSFVDLCDGIGAWIEQMCLGIDLQSNHSTVFQGNGNIVSIQVQAGDLVQAIQNGNGFSGADWPSFSNAVGNAIAAEVSTGTGTVMITGTGAPGNPGSGTGTGSLV